MAVEIELKLSCAPEHLNKLKRHPLLRSLSIARATTQKLYSVYYDTPDLQLRDHAMALRLRRVGKQWLQTLKGGGGVQAGLHQRHEWEMPVAGEKLDLDSLKASGGQLPEGAFRKLRPVFVTDFSRSVRLLKFEGAEIELGLDSGEIRAGKKKHLISELELELKAGEPEQLFKLALALSEIVPLAVENTSKAEYGYRLFSGEQPQPRKASLPQVSEGQTIASALQGMVAACLLQVQANVPGAIESSDEEYLHQVRVGLRRLRVALATAAAFRADDELPRLRQELKALNKAFGPLREWDVFITQTLEPLRARLPRNAGLRELLRACEAQRTLHRAAAVRSLEAPEFQRLLLRLGTWMYSGYWREPEAAKEPDLMQFSESILQKRSNQVQKVGKHVASADAARWHALRIACKKLRYTAEMFAALYAQEKTQPYLTALAHLQDSLGVLNDIVVAQRLLDEVEAPPAATEFVRETLDHERAAQLPGLAKAWHRFGGHKHFW